MQSTTEASTVYWRSRSFSLPVFSGPPSAPSVLVKGPKSPKPRPRGSVGEHRLGLSSIIFDRPRAPLGPFSARPCLLYFVPGRPIQALHLCSLPVSSASSLTRQTVLMAWPGRSGQGCNDLQAPSRYSIVGALTSRPSSLRTFQPLHCITLPPRSSARPAAPRHKFSYACSSR